MEHWWVHVIAILSIILGTPIHIHTYEFIYITQQIILNLPIAECTDTTINILEKLCYP